MLTADFVGVREAVSGKGSVSPWLPKEGLAVTVGVAVGVMVGASLKTAGLLALGVGVVGIGGGLVNVVVGD